MSNNNPTGINGYGTKNCLPVLPCFYFQADISYYVDPDDEMLRSSLHQYAREKLSTDQHLARLEAEHGFIIKSVLIIPSF
jgi:hypothetical protein